MSLRTRVTLSNNERKEDLLGELMMKKRIEKVFPLNKKQK